MSIQIIKRGGARPGSGRKRLDKLRRTVWLLPTTIADMSALGGGAVEDYGVLSNGIDMAAQRVAKLKPLGTLTAAQLEALFPGQQAWAESIAIWAERPEEDEHE